MSASKKQNMDFLNAACIFGLVCMCVALLIKTAIYYEYRTPVLVDKSLYFEGNFQKYLHDQIKYMGEYSPNRHNRRDLYEEAFILCAVKYGYEYEYEGDFFSPVFTCFFILFSCLIASPLIGVIYYKIKETIDSKKSKKQKLLAEKKEFEKKMLDPNFDPIKEILK